MKFQKERLVQVRENLGINKAEAARRLKMSAMGYGRYESGEREPSYQTASFIAEIFGTTVDFLYGVTDELAANSIMISSKEEPELFRLIQLIQKNEKMKMRLLAYAKKIDTGEEK